MAAQALAKYQPEEVKPGVAVESDAELMRVAGDLGTTTSSGGHLQDGPRRNGGVDDRLRLHGWREWW
jgi:choline dehydrogenase